MSGDRRRIASWKGFHPAVFWRKALAPEDASARTAATSLRHTARWRGISRRRLSWLSTRRCYHSCPSDGVADHDKEPNSVVSSCSDCVSDSDLVSLKISILGDCQIGKSTFVIKYVGDERSLQMKGLNLMNNYLLVYSLMMASDWLQGPYVYYLYITYGFGSSMFGTIVGSLADKQGRKRACVTYCISFITKYSPHYKILMVRWLLGGIATSLLVSAVESWLVA